jgi:N4-gp56 family major capsid protein
MALTTGSDLPPQVLQSVHDRMLSIKTPNLIHNTAAMRAKLPAQGGTTLRYYRYDRLPTAPVPLDGSTPPAVSPNRVDIDATVSIYGQYMALNQVIPMQNQDAVLSNMSELLGLSLRMTEDQLTRDMLAATATVYYCTGGNNGDDPSNLSLSDIVAVTTLLQGNDAWMILRNQEGEDRFGTGPLRDAYLAMAHSDIGGQLESVSGFLPKWNYPSPDANTMPSEWGAVNNVRFLLSSVGSISYAASGLGANVYNIFVQGLEALGVVEQDNFSSRILYRPPQFSDPLFQNITLGWTMSQVPRILNDQWIVNMRTTLAQ